MMSRLLAILLLFTGCDKDIDPNQSNDVDAPELQIATPNRGTIQTETSTTVTGSVSDESVVTVTIAGKTVEVGEDGRFTAKVDLVPGVNVLQTIARDEHGNESQDSRSVLFGTFAAPGDPVSEAMAIRLNQATLDVMGERIAGIVAGMDIEATLATGEPLTSDDSGCTKYDVFVDQFTASHYETTLESRNGGIDFELTIHNPNVVGRVHWKTLCILPRVWSDYTIVADWIKVRGKLDISLDANDEIVVDIREAETESQNFDFDSGIILDFADWILDFEEQLMDSIKETMEEDMPPTAQELIRGFTEAQTLTVFGSEMTLAVSPTVLEFDATGGTIVLDTSMSAMNTQGSSLGYFKSPMPLPAAAIAPTSFATQMTFADDMLNQVFHVAWSSGALNTSFPIENGDTGSLGGLVSEFRINPMAPPIALLDNENGTMSIAAGDLIIDVIERGTGDVITRVAVSLSLDAQLALGPNGGIALSDPTSQLTFDVLTEGVEGSNILSAPQIEQFMNAIGGQLDGVITSAIGEISMPTLAGTIIEQPNFDASVGYLQIRGALGIDPTAQ